MLRRLAALTVVLALASCAQPQPAPPPLPAAARAPALEGVVLDATGQARDGALVVLVTGFDVETTDAPPPLTTTTREGGHFHFDAIPAGRYGLTVTAAGATAAYGGVVTSGSASQPSMAVRLGEGGFTVRGSIVDARGEPVPKARVLAPRFSENEGEVYATFADGAGRYELTLPGGVPYLVVADASPHPRSHQRVEPVAAVVDFRLAPAPPPRPTDEAIRAWLRASAVPLTDALPGAGSTDLAPLQTMIGSARLVGLGEATHGSSELFRMKHRLVQFLVEEMGFRVFALEAGFSDALAVNDYVAHGRGDAVTAVKKLVTWAWETEEFLAMVEWMRRYNEDPSHTTKLEFQGFDVVTPAAAAAVLAYLARVDPSAAHASEALIAPFHSPAPTDAWSRPGVHEALVTLVERFDAQAKAYTAHSSENEFAIARRAALTLLRAQEENSDPSRRDADMADNVDWLVDRHPPGTRFVLWAHNNHIAAQKMGLSDFGARLRARYGRDYFALGVAFDHGSFRAMDWRGEHRFDPIELSVGAPPQESYAAALALAGYPRFLVDLRPAPESVRAWLDARLSMWSVGGWFAGEKQALVRLSPRGSFDAMVYVREVTAAHALKTR